MMNIGNENGKSYEKLNFKCLYCLFCATGDDWCPNVSV